MWNEFANYIAAALIILGSLLALIGAIGLLRLPDIYTRSHAASKAGTIGSSLAMLAIAVSSQEISVAIRAIAGLFFLLLTAPVAAHLLMRAAYLAGYSQWQGASKDDMPSGKDNPPVS